MTRAAARPLDPAPPPAPGGTEALRLGEAVVHALGLGLQVHSCVPGLSADRLLGLALRDNPRRAQLVVSRVLAKHLPVRPHVALACAALLAREAAGALDGGTGRGPRWPPAQELVADGPLAARAVRELPLLAGGPLVIGFGETATGLGQQVAAAFTGAVALHTTRRAVPGRVVALRFEEEHSHATSHLLLPADPALLGQRRPLVLVDDELTTGTTALNVVAALAAAGHAPPRVVVAALLDLRPAAVRSAFAARAAAMGVPVNVVALLSGELVVPEDVLGRAATARSTLSGPPPAQPGARLSHVHLLEHQWPAAVPLSARHGLTAQQRSDQDRALDRLAEAVLAAGTAGEQVLVVGTEELIDLPVRLAARLDASPGPAGRVLVQSTTRSPVHVSDTEGYAVRRRISAPAPDRPGPTYLYNGWDPTADKEPVRFDVVVLVSDVSAEATQPLAEALLEWAERVLLVCLPAPPEPPDPPFSSYSPQEVTWLLTDLSAVELEVATEDREELVQAGRHYAEMLPVEYQPDAAYLELFHAALAESAERLAHAVGLVAELVLDRARAVGELPVLVSLARAGTPVGILLRRWYSYAHRLDVPHVTVSIVRDRGLDEVALGWLLQRYPARSLRLVDGWTGKGAIAREVVAALGSAATRLPGAAEVDPELAVLADPGGCTSLYGTRADFLIPSACLNSTVSGLVSRTVLNPLLTGPAQFHGAKHYAELAESDVSAVFLDAVSAAFPRVAAGVAADLPGHRAADRAATWAGWASVAALAAELGTTNLNLIKPGVGETTRVLLRRVPWRVLVRPDREADLAHVRSLAAARGVPVVERADLAYSCVGVIRDLSR